MRGRSAAGAGPAEGVVWGAGGPSMAESNRSASSAVMAPELTICRM